MGASFLGGRRLGGRGRCVGWRGFARIRIWETMERKIVPQSRYLEPSIAAKS